VADATRKRGKAGSTRAGSAVDFNHAMIYTRELGRALRFYRDQLGFRIVDSYPGAYARLRSPGGNGTIALHLLDPGRKMLPASEGLRLYFEVPDLDAFCRTLEGKGVKIDQPPQDMPWGRRHAYLKDPDGHEISLYWAGPARLRQTRMSARPE